MAATTTAASSDSGGGGGGGVTESDSRWEWLLAGGGANIPVQDMLIEFEILSARILKRQTLKFINGGRWFRSGTYAVHRVVNVNVAANPNIVMVWRPTSTRIDTWNPQQPIWNHKIPLWLIYPICKSICSILRVEIYATGLFKDQLVGKVDIVIKDFINNNDGGDDQPISVFAYRGSKRTALLNLSPIKIRRRSDDCRHHPHEE